MCHHVPYSGWYLLGYPIANASSTGSGQLVAAQNSCPRSSDATIENGKKVEITVPALDWTFIGRIIRYAWLIKRSTRTMTTEVDVEDPQGVIKAGMYAYVKLPLQVANQVSNRAAFH